MEVTPWTPAPPGEHDHARLLQLFRSLAEAICRRDWDQSLDRHERFIVAFDNHMREEEERWFPRYAKLSPAAAAEVEVFLTQHLRLRQLLGGLSAVIRARSCNNDALVAFEFAWMAHDSTEGRQFDNWMRSPTTRVSSPPRSA